MTRSKLTKLGMGLEKPGTIETNPSRAFEQATGKLAVSGLMSPTLVTGLHPPSRMTGIRAALVHSEPQRILDIRSIERRFTQLH
jgi:hypothetical protein